MVFFFSSNTYHFNFTTTSPVIDEQLGMGSNISEVLILVLPLHLHQELRSEGLAAHLMLQVAAFDGFYHLEFEGTDFRVLMDKSK